jgi:hypothetical protein
MFQVLRQELENKNELTVSITPDDITEIAETTDDMLALIRIWKKGLKEIISSKALQQFGNIISPIRNVSNNIVNFILKYLDNKGFNLFEEKEALIFKFLENKKVTVFIDDLDRG